MTLAVACCVPPAPFCGQGISSRIGRRHGLRAVWLHRANPVDTGVSRIAGLPGQGCGLTLIHGVWVGRQRSRRGGRRGRGWWWRGRDFLLAPSIMMAPKVNTSIVNRSRRCFTLVFRTLGAHWVLSAHRLRSGRRSTTQPLRELTAKQLYDSGDHFQLQLGCVLAPANVNCF